MMIEADPPLLVSCQIARIVRSALLEPFQRGGDRGRIEQRSERVDRDGQLMVSHDPPDSVGEARPDQQPFVRMADAEAERRDMDWRAEFHACAVASTKIAKGL